MGKSCINCEYAILEKFEIPCCECENIQTELGGEPIYSKFTPIKDDAVNHPTHYTDGKIEVIEFIEDKKLGFCLGNAVKYISRAGKKNKEKEVEDLEKAIWYIERRIKELVGEKNA